VSDITWNNFPPTIPTTTEPWTDEDFDARFAQRIQDAVYNTFEARLARAIDREKRRMTKPETFQVIATDVRPFIHGIWCSARAGEPRIEEIVIKRWGDHDPDQVVFMLDSHNFVFAQATEMVEVVVRQNVSIGYLDPKRQKEWQEQFWASRPSGENLDLKGSNYKVQDAVLLLRKLGWTCVKPKEET
jgi:hypothetical protein